MKQLARYTHINTVSVLVTAVMALFLSGSIALGQPALVGAGIITIFACLLLCLNPVLLIYVQFAYVLFYGFLISDLHLPSMLKYGMDVINVMAFVMASYRYITTPKRNRFRFGGSGYAILLFLIVGFTTALANNVNPLLSLWAVRVFLRAPMFFFSAVILMEKKDVQRMLKFFPIYMVLNIPVFLLQKKEFPDAPDNISGFFGSDSGGNTGLNLIIVLIACLCIFGFIAHRLKAPLVLAGLATCCLFGAMSEVKVFFVELAALIILALLISKPSLSTVLIVLGIGIVFYLGLEIYYRLYPQSINIFDLNEVLAYSAQGGYSTPYDLNRLTAVQTLNADFMSTPLDSLFGCGLGAGQHTEFFSSPLYSQYGELLHWIFFSHASIFLETGFLGLAAYVMFYVLIGVRIFSCRRFAGDESWLCNAAMAFTIVMIFLLSYNSTAIIEPSYLMTWFMSVPFVICKQKITAVHKGCETR